MTLTASKETLDKCREIAGRFRHEQALNKGREIRDNWRKEHGIKPTNAREIEALGPLEWCKHYFPMRFTRQFTSYQQEFWEWGWNIQPREYYRPRVECEPRGVGKSSNAEAWVCSLLARKARKMIGYVSLNEDKATQHFVGIKAMLESEAFISDYPHCGPKIQKLKSIASQWSRDAIVTQDSAMVVPLTLQGSSRGWKSEAGGRFDVLVLDDIDALGQSADLTRKLIEILKSEILAAGDDNTVVLMPQNLIYRDSICTQIYDQRADVLSDRIFKGPYPLLRWYDAEKITIEGDDTGAKEWVITAGEAFDEAISIDYAQKLLNKFGKVTFDKECQQDVYRVEDDKDFREWDERYHLITYSEFLETMADLGEDVWNEERECLQIPNRWNVGMGYDNGTTREHPTAVAFVARPHQASPLKDCHFAFAELIMPQFPLDSYAEPELVSPGRVATAIKQIMKEWNIADSQVKLKLLSHEASSVLNTMAMDLNDEVKQFFGKWVAKKGSGVPQIQNLLEVDHSQPHPFRKYPKGYTKDGVDRGGQPIAGRPRLFFIVDDPQGELRRDATGKLYVTGAKDARGFARARFEMPLYSHRNTGEDKIDDDYVDAFRGLMNIFGVWASEKTEQEEINDYINQNMPEHVRGEELTDQQKIQRNLWAQRAFQQREVDKQQGSGSGRHTGRSIDSWRKARRG
jgi:hypothetical protein